MNGGGHRVKSISTQRLNLQSRFRPKVRGRDDNGKPKKVVAVWSSGLKSLGPQQLVTFSAKNARARQTHPGKRERRLSP